MATYNGERYVAAQLKSILSQLGEGDEVVVSDDGSTDGTLRVIAGLGDPRVRVLQHTPTARRHRYAHSTRLAAANFGNALAHARGDVVFISDQDDMWLPGKVERCLALLTDHDVVMHSYRLIDGDDRPIGAEVHAPTVCSLPKVLAGMPFMGCCMAFRREVLSDALPFPTECIMHDNWIGLRAVLRGRRILFTPEALMLYRRHGHNVSPTTAKSPNPLWFKIWLRMRLLAQAATHKPKKDAYGR